MIDLSQPIIPALSCAGIMIGNNIGDYLGELYSDPFKLEVVNYKTSTVPITAYVVNGGLLKINTLLSGEIISISCAQGYRGRCKNAFYPGISVGDAFQASSKHNLLHGALIVDRDFGFYFPLPSPHDELADSIADLPLDVKLNVLHVENIEWWFKPELTPEYARPVGK